jgi:hypothetical protein
MSLGRKLSTHLKAGFGLLGIKTPDNAKKYRRAYGIGRRFENDASKHISGGGSFRKSA